MSVLTLVRHAQASFLADYYDELSEQGRNQARLLGEYLVSRDVDFDEVYCGPRTRQRHTAEIVASAYIQSGGHWPEPVVLAEFDEYDLDGIFRALAPELSRHDVTFAELLANYHRDKETPNRTRIFQSMFEALTMHWLTTSRTFEGVEGFSAFRDRVERGLRRVMQDQRSGRRIALFTSGGVIGTAIRMALDAPDRMILESSWRVRNCSLTDFVFTRGRFTLDSFNVLPHLEDRKDWTYW